MSERQPPPPIPASVAASGPKLPYLTIAVLALGVTSVVSGLSVLSYDMRCHTEKCDQPDGMTLGMLLWGAVALLTAIRGAVGGTALILVFATPTILALVLGDLLLFLLALPILLLVFTPGAKEQILPYYRRRKGEA